LGQEKAVLTIIQSQRRNPPQKQRDRRSSRAISVGTRGIAVGFYNGGSVGKRALRFGVAFGSPASIWGLAVAHPPKIDVEIRAAINSARVR